MRSDWRADIEFEKHEDEAKKCFQLSPCRGGMLRFFEIVTKSPIAKYLVRFNTVTSLLLPSIAGDPDEAKIVEREKRKRLAAVLSNATQARVLEKPQTDERIPSEVRKFLILLPPGTDIQDIEISPEHEIELLEEFVPSRLDPEDFEITPQYEKSILTPRPQRGGLRTSRPAVSFDSREPVDMYPDTITVPEGKETPQWVKDNYELMDNDHVEKETIGD